MKRFSDFAKSPNILDGAKIKLDEVINREIVVLGFRITDSKYGKNKSGKCLMLQIEIDGERKVIFTGSDVLIEQMERYGEEVPFASVLKKVDKFYTLS
jgi:hypothetical protein